MKNLIFTLSLCFSVSSLANCKDAKLNPNDEIIYAHKCNDICVLKALSHEAREYALVKNAKNAKFPEILFFLDSSNTVHNALTETSDFLKIYTSLEGNEQLARVFKYDKISQTIEIIKISAQSNHSEVEIAASCR